MLSSYLRTKAVATFVRRYESTKVLPEVLRTFEGASPYFRTAVVPITYEGTSGSTKVLSYLRRLFLGIQYYAL
jgi:hypothetical protein